VNINPNQLKKLPKSSISFPKIFKIVKTGKPVVLILEHQLILNHHPYLTNLERSSIPYKFLFVHIFHCFQ